MIYLRNELRNMRQVNRQKKARMTKGMSTPEFLAKLSTATMLQRFDPKFIKTISCIRDSYYIFLGTIIQLDDVAKMRCNSAAAIIMTALEQMRVNIRYF